jgi:ABC-type enterochelin transport system permease subunit
MTGINPLRKEIVTVKEKEINYTVIISVGICALVAYIEVGGEQYWNFSFTRKFQKKLASMVLPALVGGK